LAWASSCRGGTPRGIATLDGARVISSPDVADTVATPLETTGATHGDICIYRCVKPPVGHRKHASTAVTR